MGRTIGFARTRSASVKLAAATGALALLMGASPPGSVDAGVTGLRSMKGQVLVCLTAQADHFPDCQNDPSARRLKLPSASAASFKFNGLPTGNYAIALIHDENGNNKLDTFMGIPREGFGFSRNPVIRFGAPSFSSAQFAVGGGAAAAETVRVKYMF